MATSSFPNQPITGHQLDAAALNIIEIARAEVFQSSWSPTNETWFTRAQQKIANTYTQATGTNLKMREAAGRVAMVGGAIAIGATLGATPVGWAILIVAASTAGVVAAKKGVESVKDWAFDHAKAYGNFIAANGDIPMRHASEIEYIGRQLMTGLPGVVNQVGLLEGAIKDYDSAFLVPFGPANPPERLAIRLVILERRARELQEVLRPYLFFLRWLRKEQAALAGHVDASAAGWFKFFAEKVLATEACHHNCAVADNGGIGVRCCYFRDRGTAKVRKALVDVLVSLSEEERKPWVRMTNDAAHFLSGALKQNFTIYKDYKSHIADDLLAPLPLARSKYLSAYTATVVMPVISPVRDAPGFEARDFYEGFVNVGLDTGIANLPVTAGKVLNEALLKVGEQLGDRLADIGIVGGASAGLGLLVGVGGAWLENLNYNNERDAYNKLNQQEWSQRAQTAKNLLQSSSKMKKAVEAAGQISESVHDVLGRIAADLQGNGDAMCHIMIWYVFHCFKIGEARKVLADNIGDFLQFVEIGESVAQNFSPRCMEKRQAQVVRKIVDQGLERNFRPATAWP